MSDEKTIDEFTDEKFLEWAQSIIEDAVDEIRSYGIGAYVTGRLGRNILFGKKRPIKDVNITIIGNNRDVVLTVRRALAMRGFKRIGETYNKPFDIVSDEWVYEGDNFQLFVYINYNRMSRGIKIPPNPQPLFINDYVMDVFALIYETYQLLIEGGEDIDTAVSDIKELMKIQTLLR